MKALQNVIVISKNGIVECWGSLTEISKAHDEIKYPSIKAKKFPFSYKGWLFQKIPYRKKLSQ